uniref:Uncharacterized protein n=1 Tax=Anguilla anguilla TaxID=7936 RepID=A0A0E9V7Y9_ANGAN
MISDSLHSSSIWHVNTNYYHLALLEILF